MKQDARGLTEAEQRVARQFPGLLTLTAQQFRDLHRDPHTLFHGEAIRFFRFLLRELEGMRRSIELMSYESWRKREILLRTLHDFFIGDPGDLTRKAAPMYRGSPSDYPKNRELWEFACHDVEQAYHELTKYVPAHVTIDGSGRHLHSMLKRPEVVLEDDPLDLIEMVRQRHDAAVRHHARAKLALAQFCFEARRNGHDPETLRKERTALERFLGHRLFAEREAEPVSIMADLDPSEQYRCRDWQVSDRSTVPPAGADALHRVAIKAERRYVRSSQNGRLIPCFFSLREKRNLALKALRKEIRFLQLIGIGDAIGMMFVVDRADLDELVREARRVLVACPGQVSDQGSSIGFRHGLQKLDPRNVHSSELYEAMKYSALVGDRIVEVQFVPTIPWIDSHCMHSRVNHGWYKLEQMLEAVFPVLFPERLTGVPWAHADLRGACINHVLAASQKGLI